MIARRLISGISALLGAAAGAQFPAFYLQYLQRLGGRLDQARIEVKRLTSAADAAGLRVTDYVERLLANIDPAARNTGVLHQATLADAHTLSQAQTELAGAIGIERPLAFVRHFNLDLALATLGDYQPALPLTVEAAAYAVTGMVLAGALVGLLASTLGRRRRRARA